MNRATVWILSFFLLLGFLGTACGQPGEDIPAVTGSAAPESPTADMQSPSSDELVPEPAPAPGASPVEPQPGQENVRPIRWKSAKALDGDRVRLRFWSGVEPCYVLDRIEVDYLPESVTITLYEGSAPSDEEVACIELALLKQTTVHLGEALAGRKILDGART